MELLCDDGSIPARHDEEIRHAIDRAIAGHGFDARVTIDAWLLRGLLEKLDSAVCPDAARDEGYEAGRRETAEEASDAFGELVPAIAEAKAALGAMKGNGAEKVSEALAGALDLAQVALRHYAAMAREAKRP